MTPPLPRYPLGCLLALAIWAGGTLPVASEPHDFDTVIAFGSCLVQPTTPFWNIALKRKANAFLLLGDVAYLSEAELGNKNRIYARFREIQQNSDFVTLRRSATILATWDDHDFGPDNSDSPSREPPPHVSDSSPPGRVPATFLLSFSKAWRWRYLSDRFECC